MDLNPAGHEMVALDLRVSLKPALRASAQHPSMPNPPLYLAELRTHQEPLNAG